MSGSALRVGVIGLGTVGQGVLRLLTTNAEEISRRVGRPIIVTDASARDLSRPRDCPLDGVKLWSDPLALTREAQVDLVVELIGGTTTAREAIHAALARKLPVATANKALIAEHGNELFDAARRQQTVVAFEAAVAGGIPIIKAIREGLAGNVISGVAGIINGTCNYILTQMTAKGEAFDAALAEAQKLGYAEADPTFDVGGIDAAHKLAILASIAFGIPLCFERIAIEGITAITPQDISIAQVFGYRIKLLGIAKRDAGAVELRVHPTLIPDDALLAKVDGVLNAVVVQGNAVGQVGLYGRGAGGDATASAVVADVIDIARALSADAKHAVPALAFQPDAVQAMPVRALADSASAFYVRLCVADDPGVLSQITAIFAAHAISVEAILQREPRGGDDAHVALITSQVAQCELDDALAQIQKLPFVHAPAVRLRVEKFS